MGGDEAMETVDSTATQDEEMMEQTMTTSANPATDTEEPLTFHQILKEKFPLPLKSWMNRK